MIYKFNKKRLRYDNITRKLILISIGSIILISGLTSLFTLNKVNDVKFITQETKTIIINQAKLKDKFSKVKLKEYILELNIRFPYIVMAQAELETGNFKSHIFKENNNLFGFKVATRRPTTTLGTDMNHAFYKNWRESVIDYALFQAAYLKDIQTETEYFEYLGENYATDNSYVDKLKKVIKNQANLF